MANALAQLAALGKLTVTCECTDLGAFRAFAAMSGTVVTPRRGGGFSFKRTVDGLQCEVVYLGVEPVRPVHSREYHDALRADGQRWRAMPHVGEQGDLELRNCPCGTTLAVEVAS